MISLNGISDINNSILWYHKIVWILWYHLIYILISLNRFCDITKQGIYSKTAPHNMVIFYIKVCVRKSNQQIRKFGVYKCHEIQCFVKELIYMISNSICFSKIVFSSALLLNYYFLQTYITRVPRNAMKKCWGLERTMSTFSSELATLTFWQWNEHNYSSQVHYITCLVETFKKMKIFSDHENRVKVTKI